MKRIFILLLTIAVSLSCFSIAVAEETPEEWVIKVLASPLATISRSDETEIGKVIKEKFGIVFEYLPLTGDQKEKQNLLLATGDYPEVISLQGNDMYNKYVKAGALVCLDDYIENSVNFKTYYEEQIPYWRNTSSDGKIYKWEFQCPQDFEVDPEFLDIAVRTDLLEQQGWPNLVTEDDWFAFLEKALADNPQTNGERTIGLTFPMAESWGPSLAVIMSEKGGITVDQGTNDVVIWDQTKQCWIEMWKNEDAIETLRWFNKLYKAGLLDPDIFTDTGDQTSQKCVTGRAAAVWYTTWSAFGANPTLISGGNEDMQYIHLPIRSNKQYEAGLKRECRVETTRQFNTCAITTACKDPERFFNLVEWCLSDEGQILLQSGIEGEQYIINDEGKREPTREYVDGTLNDPYYHEKVGFNLCCEILPKRKQLGDDGIAYALSSDAHYKDELFLTERQKEAYKALGWSNSTEYWIETSQIAPSGLAGACVLESGTDMAKLDEKFLTWAPTAYTKLIIADDFEATYAKLTQDYDSKNFGAVCDEYNRMLEEAKAAFN